MDYPTASIPEGESLGDILEAVYYSKIFSNMVHHNSIQNYEQCLVGHSSAWQNEKVN